MKSYKDIINFSIIRKLKCLLGDAFILFNNLVKDEKIINRESEFYEVYTSQYKEDLELVQNLRDKAQKIADECNKILLNMNTYHIKQYYLDKNELSEYEAFNDYCSQEFKNDDVKDTKVDLTNNIDDEEEW